MIENRLVLPVLAATIFCFAPALHAQESAKPAAPAMDQKDAQADQLTSQAQQLAYHRPTEREKLRNYAFDAFGPYAFLTAAVAGTYDQAVNKPSDWGQGWDSFATRLGSAYGIQVVTTTTRYAVAEAFREDTVYYRCACAGIVPRVKHALISTVTARRGSDGHRAFSLAATGAPYAGAMAAALGWYPQRYNAMDGLRIGNYNLAAAAAQNLALEFLYGGPHTLLRNRRIPLHRH